MKILEEAKFHTIEKAYETVEECHNDEVEMKSQGYIVIKNFSEIYEYTRKYKKKL